MNWRGIIGLWAIAGGAHGVPIGSEPKASGWVDPWLSPGSVRLGYSVKSVSNVPARSAELGMKVYFRHLAQDLDLNYLSRIYDSDQALMDDALRGRLDLLLVPGETFARLQSRKAPFAPILIKDGGAASAAEERVLLTAGGRTLNQLGRGRILVDTGGQGSLPLLWLDELLRREALPERTVHFAACEEVNRATLAVFRVFLGKADGCIVRVSDFKKACRENPQISDRLGVLAQSPPMVEAVFILSNDFAERHPLFSKELVRRLPQTERGTTLTSLLGATEIRPFDAHSATATLALVASSDQHRISDDRAIPSRTSRTASSGVDSSSLPPPTRPSAPPPPRR